MKTSTKRNKIITYIFVTVLAVFMIIPFYWMIISSLKSNNEVFTIPMKWFPSVIRWENYVTIWERVPFLTFFINTVKITLITTIIQVLTSCFAAYGFARVEFKGRDILFLIYVATIAVPWQAYMVPQFILMSKVNLTNSHTGLILLQAFNAFGVFLMRQFMLSIPKELSEAARVDGLSEYGIFARICIPLAKPGIATLVIFTFVNVWNDFMGPLIYIHKTELKTLQLGIRTFISQYGADYSLIMAASVLSLLPIIVVFMFCQRYFIEGIAAGGVKG